MKCFYHSADLDGHCSGAIVKFRFPECEMVGINYGDAFPWESINPDERVWMVDFSLQPFSDMKRLADMLDEHTGLTWVDHHKTAIIEWEEHNRPVRYAVVDNSKAACELVWAELFPDRPMPLAVYWLGRYDIWKHEGIEGCLEFQYGMRLYDTWPDNQNFWQRFFFKTEGETWAKKISQEGALLLRYEKEQNKKFAAAYSFECDLDGLRCIAVNKGFTNSLVFESVYDPGRHDAMLSFAWRHGKWTVSLYASKPEVDVSVIAKARGGGGHKGASGFQCDVLPFLPARDEPSHVWAGGCGLRPKCSCGDEGTVDHPTWISAFNAWRGHAVGEYQRAEAPGWAAQQDGEE